MKACKHQVAHKCSLKLVHGILNHATHTTIGFFFLSSTIFLKFAPSQNVNWPFTSFKSSYGGSSFIFGKIKVVLGNITPCNSTLYTSSSITTLWFISPTTPYTTPLATIWHYVPIAIVWHLLNKNTKSPLSHCTCMLWQHK